MKRFRLTVITILLTLGCLAGAFAQNPAITPVTSTEGYDFFVAFLPNSGSTIDAADLKLQLVISSSTAPGVTENIVGIDYANGQSQEVRVPVGQTAPPVNILPKNAYWDVTKGEVETPLDKGIHVYSKNNVKMTVYAINHKGSKREQFMMDGSHILPKQALGHEYIIESNASDKMASEFVVMSTVPGRTTATITLPDNIKTSTGKTTLTATFTKPYQIYIVHSQPADPSDPTIKIDLSGTTVCADQPVAVWGGNQAAVVPPGEGAATDDHAIDQLLPVERWGTQFIVPLTGLKTTYNELNIVARDNNTQVTVSTAQHTDNITLASGQKWPRLLGKGGVTTGVNLDDSTLVISATKPVQVYLFSSSAVYNLFLDEGGKAQYQGDPSMTMISPLEHLTDTTIFSTYAIPNAGEDIRPLQYEMIIWAKNTTIPSLKRNGTNIPATQFKAVPGAAFSGYRYARIPLGSEQATQTLTAAEKGFGGYVYGFENGEAVLFPVGYDFRPVEDSLFLSKKYQPREVRTEKYNAKYPDNGGGWFLERVALPKGTMQMDTVFICDSSMLRFPTRIHNNWDECKWEIMRINPNSQKRTEYTDNKDKRTEGVLPAEKNPWLEAMFTVLPEKNVAANRRHPFEDFEVRLILYRKPMICTGDDKEKWPKDTLSTIVRTYRSYNDTTYLIKCDDGSFKFFADPATADKQPTVFYCDPANPQPEGQYAKQLKYGENGPYTYSYTTVNGCENDSVATLFVLLCKNDKEVRDPFWICESELAQTVSDFGGFFSDVDFQETLNQCKNQRKATGVSGTGWKWTPVSGWANADGIPYAWKFTGTSTIRTTDCNAQMEEWHNKYGAAYPRGVPGCDKSLTVEINVVKTNYNESNIRSCNPNGYDWKYKDTEGRDRTKHFDYVPGKKIHDEEAGRYLKGPSGYPSNCPGETYVLDLEFYKSDQTITQPLTVCQDDRPVTLTHKDMNSTDDNIVFNPREHEPGVYTLGPVACTSPEQDGGCPYNLLFEVTVNKVTIHYDTIVFCYDDGSRLEYQWTGHPRFWANIKGDKTKKSYQMLTVNRPKAPVKPDYKDTRVIYELADTVIHVGECHEIFYQTLILIPPYTYANSDRHDAISTEEWFEWADVIWAGEKANTAAIPNPRNLDIIVLNEGTYTQGDWSIQYIAGDYRYIMTKANQQTKAYLREDGSLTTTCDSTVQMTIQVADVLRKKEYDYTCSNKEYVWVAGNTSIPVDLSAYQNPKDLPVTISLPQHTEKTSTKTYVVEGIDAYYDLDLTIFPAYSTDYDSLACQEPGKTVTFHEQPFKLDKPDTLTGGRPLKTLQQMSWHNPETGEDIKVQCDSGEVITFVVHPVYTQDLNTEQSTYECTLKSHDTLTFFDNPKILFVGDRFLESHPGSTLAGLANAAGVSMENVKVVEGTDPDAGREILSWYQEDKSRERHAQDCDSITFLNMTFIKTRVTTLETVHMGDNATTEWHFGGDTSSVHGSQHTQPYIDGTYFRNYYDMLRDSVGKVNFADTTAGRITKVDYFSDEEGVRTFTFEDRMLTADGVDSIILQTVVVYPTYNVVVDSAEVCASDMYHWVSKNGEIDRIVDVSAVAAMHDNRVVYVPHKLCVKRFMNRKDAQGNPLCIDSICQLKLTIFGKKNIPLTHNHCFNDPVYKWGGYSIVYNPDEYISGDITDTIFPNTKEEDEAKNCYDVLKLTVNFNPVYGVEAYKYNEVYLDPFVQDTVICQGEENFRWIDKNGNDHTYSSRLYDQYGKKLENTTKIKLDELDTEFIIYDSLKTAGCYCDSVYTLRYRVREAFIPKHDTLRLCKGEDPVDTEWIFNWTNEIKEPRYFTITQARDSLVTLVRKDLIVTDDGVEVRGCDSVYYLHILVDSVYNYTIDTVLCYNDAPFQWGGIDYTQDLVASRDWTEARTYEPVTRQYKTARNGCDSIVTLQLTIEPSKQIVIDATICSGETYDYFGEPLTEAVTDYRKNISQEGSKCKSEYILNLSVVPPTRFEVKPEPICFGEANIEGTYPLHYTFRGGNAPVSYSIYYDQKAKDSVGLVDQIDIPIPYSVDDQKAGEDYVLNIPVPELEKREEYPSPGLYSAVVGFDNGVCANDSLMRYTFDVKVQYPSWIMEQRHDDVIAILDSAYNGGHKWNRFQWYKGRQKLEGETKPYLFVPDKLVEGDLYHVVLTEVDAQGDTLSSEPACPIVISNTPEIVGSGDDDHGPEREYLAVTPTCIPLGKTTAHILARDENSTGTYRISTVEGQYITKGEFRGIATTITIPSVEGMYIVQVWDSNKESKESYRAIKVIVRDICPNCDPSSF